MTLIESSARALHRLPPETAHDLSIRALERGLVPLNGGPVTSDRLRLTIAGLDRRTGRPGGVYDKNARAVPALDAGGLCLPRLARRPPAPARQPQAPAVPADAGSRHHQPLRLQQ